MKFDLSINGEAGHIDLLASVPTCRFRFDDKDSEAQVTAPVPGIYSILLNGRSFDAHVEETPGMLIVTIDGYHFEVEVRDPRRWSRQSSGLGGAGIREILAPMPGKVIRVLVAAGDTVTVGQGLVVVEAMKMQNELKAPRDGRIANVSAREGNTVAAGEPLLTIE